MPATPDLARLLAARLSRDHLREIAGTTGLTARAALEMSLSVSLEAYAYVPEESLPVFMMGVEATGPLTGSAMVWMLATEGVSRHAAGVMRAARWGLARAFAVGGAERLEQYIPEWYDVGIRFARRLGFRAEPTSCPDRSGAPLVHVTLEPFTNLREHRRNTATGRARA